MSGLYLGLMSGTSVDGVDAVLTELSDDGCTVRRAATRPFPAPLRERVLAVIDSPRVPLTELGTLDVAVGEFFAACALSLLDEAGVAPQEVAAIGHHGQTLYHKPEPPEPFTLQIGDPNVTAARTGITTVADFRRLDVALGGQGAPLVPAFHAWRFGSADETRVVLNLGGIANVTVLRPGSPPIGFDTGPANTLLDRWIERSTGQRLDRGGAFAAKGRVIGALLHACLDEPYFAAPPPKSTGRELFNADWLDRRLAAAAADAAPEDVQATLAELTAVTVAEAVRTHAAGAARVVVCGGGAHNGDLLERLRRATGVRVESSGEHGVPPDWVEGAAFAWLARARLEGIPGNVPSVTGARRAVTLGGVYCGNPL